MANTGTDPFCPVNTARNDVCARNCVIIGHDSVSPNNERRAPRVDAPKGDVACIAFTDLDALLGELRQVLWGLSTHAECGQLHADIRDVDGLDHDLRCLRDCLIRAIALHKEVRRAG